MTEAARTIKKIHYIGRVVGESPDATLGPDYRHIGGLGAVFIESNSRPNYAANLIDTSKGKDTLLPVQSIGCSFVFSPVLTPYQRKRVKSYLRSLFQEAKAPITRLMIRDEKEYRSPSLEPKETGWDANLSLPDGFHRGKASVTKRFAGLGEMTRIICMWELSTASKDKKGQKLNLRKDAQIINAIVRVVSQIDQEFGFENEIAAAAKLGVGAGAALMAPAQG